MKRTIRYFLLLVTLAAVLAAFSLSASAVEMKAAIGVVETNGLRLRAKPSTTADVLCAASYGDSVVIIREVDGWYLVDYNLEIGYMSAEYVTYKERENVELGDGRAIESSVNMRSTPSSDGDLLYQLPYGDEAYIIGFNCGWDKVKYNGETGYIRSDLMELTEKPIANSAASSLTSLATQVVDYAMKYLGTPYVWGANGPNSFDCSGYTKYVYKNFGYTLNRTAAQQLNNGSRVDSLQVGDLVFFNNTYASAGAASHVGIYIGNNQFIHAASGGVKITSLSDAYYASRYIGARRII